MNAQEEGELKKLTSALENNKQQLLIKQEHIDNYDNDIADLSYKGDQLAQKQKRYNFNDYKNHTTKNDLINERKTLEEDIVDLQYKIETLTRCIPLLANQTLLANVKEQLDIQLYNKESQHNKKTIDFLKTLPELVFSELPPPPTAKISSQQYKFYTAKLRNLCNAHNNTFMGSITKTTDSFATLSKTNSKVLQITITIYGDLENKQKYRSILQNIQDKHHKIASIKQKLDNLVQISPEERQYSIELKEQEKEIENNRIDAEAEKKKLYSEIEGIHTKIAKLETDIKAQEEQVRLSHEIQQRKKYAEEIQVFFRHYKQNLKEDKRSALEQAINQHFRTLMTSHHQIAHIKVTEDFSLNYLDRQTKIVAMGNISAGMKQIIATALLWALKDVSDKNLPMIIDTPLARIDMNHQYHLLQHYYPKVAKQIILLPTDSEIDPGKYTALKPHIYREYCLRNTNGDNSYFEKTAMCWKTE
ncbi:MAG: hypothetical protein R8K21_09280 [Mariprofundales bacterium]